jgi:hypothetical protein
MMNLLRYWPPLLHLTLLGVLLPLAVWQWLLVPEVVSAPIGAPFANATAPSERAVVGPDDETTGSFEQADGLDEIIARPLFRQGRQLTALEPVLEPEPEPVPEPDVIPSQPLRMVGYVNNGFVPAAIIFVPDEGVEYVVREGDKIVGMDVIAIEPDKVFLSNSLENVTVSMFGE